MNKIQYFIRTDQNEIFKTEKGLFNYFIKLEQQAKKQKEVIDKATDKLDIIIHDLEEHEEEAPLPSIKELCEIFNILKEVSE